MNKRNTLSSTLITTTLLFGAFVTAGCPDGDAENAMEDAGEAIDDAGDEIEDAVDGE